jgi:hypothetical protein
MVENKRRSLPLSALIKISELEITLKGANGSVNPAFGINADHLSLEPVKMQQLRAEKNRTHLLELQLRLLRMAARKASIHEALHNLQCLLQPGGINEALPGRLELELQHDKLCRKLKCCGIQAQALVKSKIAMLEMLITLSDVQPVEMSATLPAQMEAATKQRFCLSQGDKPGACTIGRLSVVQLNNGSWGQQLPKSVQTKRKYGRYSLMDKRKSCKQPVRTGEQDAA